MLRVLRIVGPDGTFRHADIVTGYPSARPFQMGRFHSSSPDLQSSLPNCNTNVCICMHIRLVLVPRLVPVPVPLSVPRVLKGLCRKHPALVPSAPAI